MDVMFRFEAHGNGGLKRRVTVVFGVSCGFRNCQEFGTTEWQLADAMQTPNSEP